MLHAKIELIRTNIRLLSLVAGEEVHSPFSFGTATHIGSP